MNIQLHITFIVAILFFSFALYQLWFRNLAEKQYKWLKPLLPKELYVWGLNIAAILGLLVGIVLELALITHPERFSN